MSTPQYYGSKIDWKSRTRIPAIASQVNTRIAGRSVLIGHSTGGLVARSVQKINNNVKGIIIVGTPNQGAGVVASLNNRSYSHIIAEMGHKANRTGNKSLTAAANCAPPITWVIAPITQVA